MTPVLLAFLSALLWGLWWIPIRYLETQGLTGAWGALALNSGALVATVLWMAARRPNMELTRRGLIGAVLVGLAVTTYSAAVNHTDVVRAILLFYLAPAWSKMIEWRYMGRPWSSQVTLAIVASLGGAYLVLGGDLSSAQVTMGDFMAVLSGMAWAAGAALVFTSGPSGAAPLVLTAVVGALATGFPLALIWGWPASGTALVMSGASGMAMGVFYVLPILALTMWAAQRLAPTTLSFLLTAEIISGVASSAWLLDEPFGAWQLAGAILIVVAALSEIVPGLRSGNQA